MPVLAQVESNHFGLTAAFHRCETLRMTDDADEDLTMRATVIGGQHCADDFQVIWPTCPSVAVLPSDQPKWSHPAGVQNGMGTHPTLAYRSRHHDGAQIRREQCRLAREI